MNSRYLILVELYTEYGLFQRLNKIEEDYEGATVILVKQGILTPVSTRGP